MRGSVCRGLLGLMLFLAVPAGAGELRLLGGNLRASFSASDILGTTAPVEFEAYETMLRVGLPWQTYTETGWGVGTRLLVSAGVLRGAGASALTVSLIPTFALGDRDGRLAFDCGVGMGYLSRHRFGPQDFGGPFQFALTAGASLPLWQRYEAGYRFLHYSDAGTNGSDTVGADLHLVEIGWRF